jgi:hypothetical protein
VESPGTAPGSEPFIMGAFIAIVRVAPDSFDIGAVRAGRKACGMVLQKHSPRFRGAMLGGLVSLETRFNHLEFLRHAVTHGWINRHLAK